MVKTKEHPSGLPEGWVRCEGKERSCAGDVGSAGGKGVRWLAGYFMGYYTIWLSVVKRIVGSVLGTREGKNVVAASLRKRLKGAASQFAVGGRKALI